MHTGKKSVTSNVVWKYGYCSIPRHLRDIVITEYGMADLRGQSDETCIQRMICIADSRFQEDLRAQAVAHKKLSVNWQVPSEFCNNSPERLNQQFKAAQQQGYFPTFPFGKDFSAEQLTIINALQWLQHHTNNKYTTLLTVIKALFITAREKDLVYLQMMQLESCSTIKERLYAKLLIYALRQQ